VDFNQGVDARILAKDEMYLKEMSTICIKPLRIAFDHLGVRKPYEKAIRMAHEVGLNELSNYMLYNYRDTPKDLFERLKINIELNEELMAEEGGRLDDQVNIRPYVPTPERTAPPASVQSPLERVQEQVAELEEAVRQGETVEVGFLEELEEASSELAESLGDPGEVGFLDRMVVASAAGKEYELLQMVQEQSSGFEARAVEASLAAAALESSTEMTRSDTISQSTASSPATSFLMSP